MRSCNQCCHRKSNRYYIYWVCVYSLRYPACNAHAPYFHLWPVRLYHIFPPYPINGTVFEREVIEHEMCVLIFSENLYETFLIIRRNGRIWEMYVGLHVKYLLFLSDSNGTWISNDRFSKNAQISNFMKLLPLLAELFLADGQMTKVI